MKLLYVYNMQKITLFYRFLKIKILLKFLEFFRILFCILL